ncbi:hypothetical protein [Rosistilla oblonga]|uniref:hypothetical protein n=1 Tax=Rosistilla oblonga TaxID=2527990 RepID=UPI003A9778F9
MSEKKPDIAGVMYGTFLATCGVVGILLGNIGFFGLLMIGAGATLIVYSQKQ